MRLNVEKLLILKEQFCWSALELWLAQGWRSLSPLLSTGEATSEYSCPHLAPSSRRMWRSWQGPAKAAQGLEHLTHQDMGLLGLAAGRLSRVCEQPVTTERAGAKVVDWTKLYLVSSVTRGTSPVLHHGRLKREAGEETFPTSAAVVLAWP